MSSSKNTNAAMKNAMIHGIGDAPGMLYLL
jgi:hypothetical protein